MNLAVFGCTFGQVLVLSCSRRASGGEGYTSSRDASNIRDDQEAERLIEKSSTTKVTPRTRTGYEHSSILLSFAEERLGRETILAYFKQTFKFYMVAYHLLLVVWVGISILQSIQVSNGTKPVYERTSSHSLNVVLQGEDRGEQRMGRLGRFQLIASLLAYVLTSLTPRFSRDPVAVFGNVLGGASGVTIAFIGPLYVFFYTTVFSQLLDELVFTIATKRMACDVESLNLSSNEFMLLIIQEHKLIDSLLRVTCKRVETFVSFALGSLFSILLLIAFKYTIASSPDGAEGRAQSIEPLLFVVIFLVSLTFLRMLSKITTKCDLLPQMVNRIAATNTADPSSTLLSTMCTTSFLIQSKMAWRIHGARVTSVLVMRMIYVVGSFGVFVLSRLSLQQ